MRTLVLSLATLALLSISLAPAAGAADAVRCVPLKDGSKVCVTVEGTCASADYVPPFTDSGAGAGACTTGSAGPAGVVLCQEAIAGYVTIAGWWGVWVKACAVEYEDASGRTCFDADADSSHFELADVRPVCVLLA